MHKPPTSTTKILALPPGRYYYGDGLVLVVTAGKRRTSHKWLYRYTKPGTKRVTETSIGSVQAFTYQEARSESIRLQGLIARGIDPVQAEKQEKVKGITYAEACAAFIEQHELYRWRSTKNIKNLLGQVSSLDQIPVSAVTTPMLKEALAPVWKKHPYQVIRALPRIARVFGYAKSMKWCSGENPAAWKDNMKNFFDGLPERKKHHASLPTKDVPSFIQRLKLRQVRGTSAVALEFLILTAARTGEVRGALWAEFDLENKVWTLPPERTKQNREHRVPLSQRCMEILALQQEYRIGDLVFTGYRRSMLADKALRSLLGSMGEPITPHGFRGSFRNWTFHTRQDRDLAELSLGHDVAEDRTEGAYLTVDGIEARRPLMEAWSQYCAGSTSGC